MFKPLDPKKDIAALEEDMAKFWDTHKIFNESMKQREGGQRFVFYEGPPTANGRPGIHHVMARTFKDLICRFQTMKGRYVLRKAGWDTHGLPVELQVEKQLGLKSKHDIERYGIAKFNAACRESVWQYKGEWEKLTRRMGYWIDLGKPYITYEPEYIESVWWVLKQIWDKGLIYQDYKVVPYCPRCGTALSLAEVAQGYKDVTETSVYVKFLVSDEPDTYLLAWTTTPWTLPGNVALAVGGGIDYCLVEQSGQKYYLAKERLSILVGEYKVLKTLKGADLVGKRYQPLFDFLDLAKETGKEAYKVVVGDFVSTADGTGVVHTAVMYGEEDFSLGKQLDLPAVHTVDEQGHFSELVPPWQGRFVKDAEPEIIKWLEQSNRLYKTESTLHTYPFCWRCGTPLLYYARNSWFIKITSQLKERLVKLNQTVHWVPEHLRDGRFGNWLEGLRDWAISRERYWGTPLPIWICEADTKHRILIGSYGELHGLASESQKSKVKSQSFDPHKPFIDEIELMCNQCDGQMKRIPEVLDVWFDSGSMPFAQWHYPFENRDIFQTQYPADYISEGVDQTRGWFNSLLIISAVLNDQVAYKSVISPNLVLDEMGQKMSKSKGNVVDPWEVMEQFGVDALRLYFLSVNQPGDNKYFSLKAVGEVYRKTIMIWLNVVNFFLTYGSLDDWQPGQKAELTTLDAWLVSLTNEANSKIGSALDELDSFRAARVLQEYIDSLSTWYLRRSRRRRDQAFYSTFYQALTTTAKLAAPFMPFVAELTYQSLKADTDPKSVHLCDWPRPGLIDSDLLKQMVIIRQLATLGHAARTKAGLKLRQPLAKVVVLGNEVTLSPQLLAILADELNVQSAEIADSLDSEWISEEGGLYKLAIDPNLTDELKKEGLFRELVRAAQEFRKQAGCQPGEQVTFHYQTNSQLLAQLIKEMSTRLTEEVNGQFVTLIETTSETKLTQLTIEGELLNIGLVNVG